MVPIKLLLPFKGAHLYICFCYCRTYSVLKILTEMLINIEFIQKDYFCIEINADLLVTTIKIDVTFLSIVLDFFQIIDRYQCVPYATFERFIDLMRGQQPIFDFVL